MLKNSQKKEIERVCGKDFTWSDVPSVWKQEWLEKGLMTEEELERLEDEKHDYHPRPEEVE